MRKEFCAWPVANRLPRTTCSSCRPTTRVGRYRKPCPVPHGSNQCLSSGGVCGDAALSRISATASSTSGTNTAAMAVDASTGTRWESLRRSCRCGCAAVRKESCAALARLEFGVSLGHVVPSLSKLRPLAHIQCVLGVMQLGRSLRVDRGSTDWAELPGRGDCRGSPRRCYRRARWGWRFRGWHARGSGPRWY